MINKTKYKFLKSGIKSKLEYYGFELTN
jgi:hypothetical protein